MDYCVARVVLVEPIETPGRAEAETRNALVYGDAWTRTADFASLPGLAKTVASPMVALRDRRSVACPKLHAVVDEMPLPSWRRLRGN